MQPARRLATYDDLLAAGDQAHAEVLGGVLVTPPPPMPEHGRAHRSLARFIGGPFDDDDGRGGPGGWWILVEVDVRLGPHDIVRPDVAGWRRERMPSPWGKRPIEVVPDWIAEVISPSNEAQDRVHKRQLYARSGVAFYWVLDPTGRTLEIFRLVGGVWTDAGSYDDTATARIPPFEAVAIEVGRLLPPRG